MHDLAPRAAIRARRENGLDTIAGGRQLDDGRLESPVEIPQCIRRQVTNVGQRKTSPVCKHPASLPGY
jgi:hypothetical protein